MAIGQDKEASMRTARNLFWFLVGVTLVATWMFR